MQAAAAAGGRRPRSSSTSPAEKVSTLSVTPQLSALNCLPWHNPTSLPEKVLLYVCPQLTTVRPQLTTVHPQLTTVGPQMSPAEKFPGRCVHLEEGGSSSHGSLRGSLGRGGDITTSSSNPYLLLRANSGEGRGRAGSKGGRGRGASNPYLMVAHPAGGGHGSHGSQGSSASPSSSVQRGDRRGERGGGERGGGESGGGAWMGLGSPLQSLARGLHGGGGGTVVGRDGGSRSSSSSSSMNASSDLDDRNHLALDNQVRRRLLLFLAQSPSVVVCRRSTDTAIHHPLSTWSSLQSVSQ